MGAVVLAWLQEKLRSESELDIDIIDLAEIELPPSADLVPGGSAIRTAIADRIESADAYVFLTPEYNHSFPASLKHAIDWHYREWNFKPAMIVSYGVSGGWLAAEQLRQVLAELHVVTARRVVGIAEPWLTMKENGQLEPSPSVVTALKVALSELSWWAHALHVARRDKPYVN
jgi:NAD(P)H-dependent FMN reductase